MTPQLAQLIAKLQEIFQINQPDLDFGIYRILNSRQTQINEFLQKTLPNKINAAFNGNFEQANNVYNHLYTFFSRYYDQGDFISQRRYKGDTYAIPYAGEEVMLHWANKDQYYTKSGESFSNYAFTLENGKKVQFRLVEADTAKDNRKDNDQARVFALIEPQIKTETDENGDEIQTDILPFDIQGDLLTLRFEYKSVNKKEKQSDYIMQAVEKIQNFAIPDEFQGIFKAMPTEKNRNRTLLEKYLTDYTAKNTADYFIHKNLGKFLNQELDFYIKNEVMNLDNIQDSTDFSHIEQNLQTIKTIKIVAKEIIAFLAQLEDFQKKLWLKKKFVAGCHYLITLDHLTEEQAQEALDNPKQTAQWQALFSVNTNGLNATEICKNYPHLVVDTALFEPTFQADVLREIEHLDDKTNGLLIHSDNFQALNLLQERYKEQVKCIYIDPPYNTEKDRTEGKFVYKDGYPHSTWLSLLTDRVTICKNLMNESSLFLSSIDDNEVSNLKIAMDYCFTPDNFIDIFSWQKTTTPPNLSKQTKQSCEYILGYQKEKNISLTGIRKNSKSSNGLMNQINNVGVLTFPAEYTTTKLKDGIYKAGIYGTSNYVIELLEDTEVKDNKFIKPITLKGKFKWGQNYLDASIKSGVRVMIQTKAFSPSYEKEEYAPEKPWNIINSNFNVGTNENASTELDNLFWQNFSDKRYPKPVSLMKYILNFHSDNSLILDYFAGSGTTAHAVINLNREDDGNRKYILVEQGEYFDSVLKPRVQKVIFAKEWKDGKPQADNGVFGGVSQIVKVLKLESYEDTLNNLELKQPASDLFAQNEALQNDYLLHYMLDVESRDSLLNTQHFTKPFDYQLNIATTSAGAYEAKNIDLVETFNYLIGLRVRAIDDQREKRGWVTVKGKLANDNNALIIWRDCEKIGYGELNDFIRKNAYGVEDKAEYSEETFKVVYINGDHNVPTVFTDSNDSVKTLKVRSIEAEFLSRMFG
ncbi:TPA: site-specific DNA-methyltransferase [Haemophilus influenzae 10810]